MFAPNLDDPCDLYAYIIQQHPHPISLQQIPTMWWMIVLMLLAIIPLAMQHIKCYCPDWERYPKRCMLLQWHAILMWYELVFSDVKYVWPLRWNRHRTIDVDLYHWWLVVLQFHRTFQKNQCRRIVMSWLNLVKFCDLYLQIGKLIKKKKWKKSKWVNNIFGRKKSFRFRND